MDLHHETELVSIEDLKPYGNNPKKHPSEQIEKLKKSIKEFGFTVPLIIGEDNEIIAGHGRLLAAKQLGIEKLPCIKRTDLTEEQMKAFRIADNKLTESGWDEDKLNVELEELGDSDIDLELTGFDELELDKLQDNLNIDLPDGEVDEPEPQDDKVVIHIEADIDKWNEQIEFQDKLKIIAEDLGGNLDVA